MSDGSEYYKLTPFNSIIMKIALGCYLLIVLTLLGLSINDFKKEYNADTFCSIVVLFIIFGVTLFAITKI